MITWTRHACRALALCLTTVLLVGTPADAAALAAPTKLTAKPTSSSVAVSWAKVSSASSYSVCLQTSKAAKSCYKTVRTKKTRASFIKLKPTGGTDYFFRVTAVKGKSTKRSALKGFNLASRLKPPAAPAGISRRTASASVRFTWAKAAGATEYSVCLLPSATAATCLQTSTRSPDTTAAFSSIGPNPGHDYYYRVRSHNAAGTSASRAYWFDLAVSKVAGLTAKPDAKQHFVIDWTTATNASTYDVQIATNAAMTTGLVSGTTATKPYTSAALKPGTTYYLRVRGLNDTTPGSFSAVSSVRLGTAGTTARVITYNLCGQDKCLSSANKMAKWSTTRKALAGSLVRSADADIIATQESSYNDTKFGSQLPGFTLAQHKSAKSLFFKASKYTKVKSGDITLSSSLKKYAVWADLKDISSGTRFIVVDAHLQSGKGKSKDDERTRETTTLINAVKKINPYGLPVIYAGDFNSNASNAKQSSYKGGYDAPLRVFTAAGAVDSYNVAQSSISSIYNSANQALNPPLKSSHHVDHIFTSPDVQTLTWKVMLRLDGSKYAVPFASDHNPIVADLAVPGR